MMPGGSTHPFSWSRKTGFSEYDTTHSVRGPHAMKKTAGGFGLCLQHLWLASTVVLRDSDSSLTRSRNLEEEEPLPHCSQFLYCLERTPQENDSSLADSQEGLTSIDHPLWFFPSSGHLRQNRFKQTNDIPWLSQQQVVVVSHSLPDPPPTH